VDLVKLKKVLTKYKVKEVDKILAEFYSENINTLHGIICMKRFHKNMKSIISTDAEYRSYSDIATLAEEFCNLYDLEIIPGFNIYVDLGIQFIGNNYSLNKFKTYNEKIISAYSNEIAIKADKNSKETDYLIKLYARNCSVSYDDVNTYYRHDFIHMKNACEIHKISTESWLKSQFDFFNNFGKTPEPYQLHGFEATKRALSGRNDTTDWRNKLKNKISSNV
jgi:hypothetical protein